MFRIKNNSAGFTLVELIIYMGLMSVVITILTSMFVTILEAQLDSAAHTDLVQESQYILSRLQYDISRSQALISPAAVGVSGNELILDTGDSQLEYDFSSGTFQLTDDGVAYPLHSDRLETISFTATALGSDTGSPVIDLTLELRDKATDQQVQYTATYGLRP